MVVEIPRGKAAYKKKDGILTLTEDQVSLIWSPLPGDGPPVVSLQVANITNLQQTPDTAAKVMLKVFEKPRTSEGDPATYLFHFTSPTDARTEANAVKALLSQILSEIRSNDPSVPKPVKPAQQDGQNGSGPGPNVAKPPVLRWFDDEMLRNDIDLQESLMLKNEALRQTYEDARASKPASISDATFNSHFWSTRLNLLRAHAIDQNQKKGSYNVLSTIKPRVENGELKMALNVEQIQMIFQQHPLVKRIYNENVPKIKDAEFFSRFFLSKLFKKLKGERITENDNSDNIFDKYMNADNTLSFASRIMTQQVPQFIDVQGNEENQGGFKGGNRPHFELRPRKNVPIIETLNSLSEKIMATVAPTDMDPAAADIGPDGLDNTTLKNLSLRDLRGYQEPQKFVLNAKEQSELFANQDPTQSEEAKIYEKQVPSDVLFDVQADIDTLDDDGSGGIDLHKSIGVDDDSDSGGDDTDGMKKPPHPGSRAARKQGQTQIFDSLAKKKAELRSHEDDEASPMAIPPEIAQRCYLTNATTTEFLKQFWSVYLSGDPARSEELAYHVDSLRRSAERIEALAAEAEKIRQQRVEKRKREIKEHFRATGKKLRWVNIAGGEASVRALFEATLGSLNAAQAVYKKTRAP